MRIIFFCLLFLTCLPDKVFAQTIDQAIETQSGGAGAQETKPAVDWSAFVGPAVLGATGAVMVGFGIYALIDPSCDVAAMDGTCLIGDRPNPVMGGLLLGTGGLALVLAFIWYGMGSTSLAVSPPPTTLATLGRPHFGHQKQGPMRVPPTPLYFTW